MSFNLKFALLLSMALLISCEGKERAAQNHVVINNEESLVLLPSREDTLFSNFITSVRTLDEQESVSFDEVQSLFREHFNRRLFDESSFVMNVELNAEIVNFHKVILEQLRTSNGSTHQQYLDLIQEYYLLLKDECEVTWSRCVSMAFLRSDPYTGEMFFFIANRYHGDDLLEYYDFLTSMSGSGEQPDIIVGEIEALMDAVSAEELTVTQRNIIFNGVVRLSRLSAQADEELLLRFYSYMKRGDESLVSEFYRFITQLMSSGVLLEESDLIQQIMSDSVAEAGSLGTQENEFEGGLFWGNDMEIFSEEDLSLQEKYVLHGIVNPFFGAHMHRFIATRYLSDDVAKQALMGKLESLVRTEFVLSVYESHQIISDVLNRELSRAGRVEPILLNISRYSDGALAELWNQDFRSFLNRMTDALSPFYSRREMANIINYSNKLEKNIKLMVLYPALFVIGYHISMQGDFDYEVQRLNPWLYRLEIWHMSAEIYFQELFRGSFPTFFSFLDFPVGTEQENLFSFYYSGDKYLHDLYELPSNFLQTFLLRYFVRDRKILIDSNEDLDTYNSESGVGRRLMSDCEKIQEGDFDFEYDMAFSQSLQHFFRGFVSTGVVTSGRIHPREYLSYLYKTFNGTDTARNLSSTTEYWRVETSLRMNRMKVLEQAFREQGDTAHADQLSSAVTEITDSVTRYLDRVEGVYREAIQCALVHDEMEMTMQRYFRNSEFEFLKFVRQSLMVLNTSGAGVSVEEALGTYDDQLTSLVFEQLPETGNFFTAVNDIYDGLLRTIAQRINGYEDQYMRSAGFRSDSNGIFRFHSTWHDTTLRRMALFMDSDEAGVSFPKMVPTDLPQDADVLADIRYPGFKRDQSISLSYTASQSEQEFVRTAYKSMHKLSMHRYHHPASNEDGWRQIYLNYASLLKAKAFFDNFGEVDSATIKANLSETASEEMSFLLGFTLKLKDFFSLTEEDIDQMEILGYADLKMTDDFFRRVTGISLFYFIDYREEYDLKIMDVFFSVLSSMQLGRYPVLRTETFGRDGYNPLLDGWGRQEVSHGGGGPNEEFSNGSGDPVHIQPENILFPTDLDRYARRNAETIYFWDQNYFIQAPEHVAGLVHNEIKSILGVDHALQEFALDWIIDAEDQELEIAPYQFNLRSHPEPVSVRGLLTRSIVDLYWESRDLFDEDTRDIFKEAE